MGFINIHVNSIDEKVLIINIFFATHCKYCSK